MPINSVTLPQNTEPIITVSLRQVVQLLPLNLPQPIKVWIGGDMGRYGRTAHNLIFVTDTQQEPSAAIRAYVNNLFVPLGIQATVMNNWKDIVWTDRKAGLIPLYNAGRLIIDKVTMAYTETPSPTQEAPVITIQEVKDALPDQIEWTDKIWLTGSVVRKGWSCNDVDMMVGDMVSDGQGGFTFVGVRDVEKFRAMRTFFTDLFGWRTDVGYRVMPEREPVYVYKIYEGGNLCPM